MAEKSTFAEILEGKLEKDPTNFSSTTLDSPWDKCREFDTQPAHMAFLMGQLSRPAKPQLPRKSPYPPPSPRPMRPHLLNDAQTLAQQFFCCWGETLTPAFSKAELKSAFRRLAKKLHPDLSKRSGAEFIKLRDAFNCLLSVPRK